MIFFLLLLKIYNCIGALITTPNDLARVYFMVGPDGNYEAILRIQEGKCTDEKGKVKVIDRNCLDCQYG